MYLIDTNVLSDAYRRLEPPSRWLAQIDPDLAFVSVVTMPRQASETGVRSTNSHRQM